MPTVDESVVIFPARRKNSSNLRVCLVTCFPPSRGDLNEYGFHLACTLREEPDVDLVLLADEVSAGQELDGFTIERCWRFNSLLTPARLLRAIRKLNPDVVWFNMGFSTFARGPLAAFMSIMGPAITRWSGFYTHVTLHTIFERINLKDAGVRVPGAYRFAGKVATRVLLCANDVSVLLPSFRSELIQNYNVDAEHVHFRPHGIFSRTSPKRRLNTQAQEQVILAFGYWGTYKRLELLLESLGEVSKRVPRVRLVIGGLNHPTTPGYLESLQAQYANRKNIQFLGYVPESDLPDLFRKARVLVLPYTSAAGTSGVVHQACEYGLPMVAAAIPEIEEIAREYGAAIKFYRPGDRLTLSDHLIRILSSDDLRQRMAQQNLSVGSGMQISQVVGGYLNLFKARTRRLHKVSGFRTKHESVQQGRVDRTVGDWMLHSGIEQPEGGVARYYLADIKRNKPVSTEITGYCVSALVLLHEQTGEMRYWDAAVKNVKYLTKTAWDANCSAMPFECEGDGQKYSYFFDAGIIVRGLLTVWRRCKHSDLLSRTMKCGESMAQDFFDGKDFYPVITLPDKKPLQREPLRWSRSADCYRLKAALGWRELWEASGEERFDKLYRGALESSLATHRSFLPGVENESLVMDRLHAYAYFLEGLLPVVSEPACREAMQTGIEALAMYTGKIAPRFLRSDVVAQLLRIRLYANLAGVVTIDPETARQEAGLIREFQSADPDPRLKGGFWFGRKDGKFLPYMNPVSTVFCYQALDMWERYAKGERNFQWQKLI
jgi:glycosyltransferase involved in cell wall biosynthesis